MPAASATLIRAALCLLGAVAFQVAGAQEDSQSPQKPAYMAPKAHSSMLFDAVAVGERLVAVGERGHVVLSDDAGASWRQAPTPTRSALTGVFFPTAQIGFAVGHDAIILRTEDGGENWVTVHFAPEMEMPLFDLWFRDPQRGFAVGAYGLYLETSDGGRSWAQREFKSVPYVSGDEDTGIEAEAAAESDADEDDFEDDYYDGPEDYHLNQVAQASNGMLYLAGEAGQFYRSRDFGVTWESMPTLYEGTYFATLALQGNSVLAFGLVGHLLRSDDAGVSWTEPETGVQVVLNDGVVLDDGRILIAGMAGTLLLSEDDGKTFELVQQSDRKAIAALLALGDGAILTIGEAGVRRLSSAVWLAGGAEE